MACIKLMKVLVLGFLLLGIASCTCNRTKEETPEQTVEQQTLLNKEFVNNYFSMPSPEEILTYFYSTQLEYHSNITCPTSDIEKYLENETQLQMIGVYTADLAYLTIFKKQSEIMDYFSAIQNLAEKTRISAAFKKNIILQVIDAQNDIDSLAEIARNSYIQVISYLISFERHSQLSLIFYGAFIESMYLSFEYIDNYSVSNDLIEKIATQKYAFDNLYGLSQLYLTKENNEKIVNNIEKIKTIYESMTLNESKKSEVPQTNEDKLVIDGDEEIMMTEIQFNQFKELITGIRNELIH